MERKLNMSFYRETLNAMNNETPERTRSVQNSNTLRPGSKGTELNTLKNNALWDSEEFLEIRHNLPLATISPQKMRYGITARSPAADEQATENAFTLKGNAETQTEEVFVVSKEYYEHVQIIKNKCVTTSRLQKLLEQEQCMSSIYEFVSSDSASEDDSNVVTPKIANDLIKISDKNKAALKKYELEPIVKLINSNAYIARNDEVKRVMSELLLTIITESEKEEQPSASSRQVKQKAKKDIVPDMVPIKTQIGDAPSQPLALDLSPTGTFYNMEDASTPNMNPPVQANPPPQPQLQAPHMQPAGHQERGRQYLKNLCYNGPRPCYQRRPSLPVSINLENTRMRPHIRQQYYQREMPSSTGPQMPYQPLQQELVTEQRRREQLDMQKRVWESQMGIYPNSTWMHANRQPRPDWNQ